MAAASPWPSKVQLMAERTKSEPCCLNKTTAWGHEQEQATEFHYLTVKQLLMGHNNRNLCFLIGTCNFSTRTLPFCCILPQLFLPISPGRMGQFTWHQHTGLLLVLNNIWTKSTSPPFPGTCAKTSVLKVWIILPKALGGVVLPWFSLSCHQNQGSLTDSWKRSTNPEFVSLYIWN